MERIDRFWIKVQRCAHGENCSVCCWIWKASTTSRGYGQFVDSTEGIRRNTPAHRISWTLTRGDIPDGLNVLHNCPDGDNKACVNPRHLWLGTDTDNMQDALRKGQLLTGDRHPARRYIATHHRLWERATTGQKLTADTVRDIRYLAAHGMQRRLLAQIYQVSKKTICDIVVRNYWKHIE